MKKRKDPRKAEITSIGDAIQNLFKEYKTQNRFDEANLIASWEQIMGKPIANRTGKLFIKKDVLFVEITSAPLKHELNMSKQRILERFHEELGKQVVEQIIFL